MKGNMVEVVVKIPPRENLESSVFIGVSMFSASIMGWWSEYPPVLYIPSLPLLAVKPRRGFCSMEAIVMETTLTRGKAIHARCVDCVGFQLHEVKRCQEKDCPLYPYRTGTAMKDKPVNTPIRSKAIKHYCIDCVGTIREVRRCPAKRCPLFKYRMGRKE